MSIRSKIVCSIEVINRNGRPGIQHGFNLWTAQRIVTMEILDFLWHRVSSTSCLPHYVHNTCKMVIGGGNSLFISVEVLIELLRSSFCGDRWGQMEHVGTDGVFGEMEDKVPKRVSGEGMLWLRELGGFEGRKRGSQRGERGSQGASWGTEGG